MTYKRIIQSALFSLPMLALASCYGATAGDSSAGSPSTMSAANVEFTMSEHGSFDDPWALAVEPGTGSIFVTEQAGTIKFFQPSNGGIGVVSGVPEVDYGGQGGLGDFAFAPDYETSRHVYLSWVEAGDGDRRGAVVGRGTLTCDDHDSCEIRELDVIWQQAPKVTGRGHFSHRIAFSPDGQHLFIASGDRQKMEPAQDLSNTLGTIVRLNLDGSPAEGNPFADRGSPSDQIWSYGHRNMLGLQFDASGKLWDLEHGPAGGDELNVVRREANYGWPAVSNGKHYNGDAIPDHATDASFSAPAISWTPVIAPGDFLFYHGDMLAGWQGNAIIAGLKSKALVIVKTTGDSAEEIARIDMDERLRDVAEGPDGSLWVLEDGDTGRLLRLTKPS